MTPLELERIVNSLGRYVFVEDLEVSHNVHLTGLGVLLISPPRSVSMRIAREFRKVGKVFYFSDVEMGRLASLMHYAFMFSTAVGGVPADRVEGRKVGVVYVEVANSTRAKMFLRKSMVHRGRVCRGKRCYDVNWFIYIPVYVGRGYLVVCDEEDLVRRRPDGSVEYPLLNLLLAYGSGRVERYTASLTLPVFRYSPGTVHS